MVIHSSNSHPNYLWNIEVGRVRGGEGGDSYLRLIAIQRVGCLIVSFKRA